MGLYTYMDGDGHVVTMDHRMLYTTSVICNQCGAEMWRKPQPVNVTWGGLAPSQGQIQPNIQELIDTADERRDKFNAEHEEHERRGDN